MLDWGALIGEREPVENAENSPPSGDSPHYFLPDSEIVGRLQPSNGEPFRSTPPLSPPSPLKKHGGRLETENETRARGGATDNLSDEKTYPVNPVAVCLLLACCDRIKADEQETIEAILSLRHYPPAEQVRAWALLCVDNGIDPVQVQQLYMPSPGAGIECRGCIHLTMEKIRQLSGRRVFRFVCSKQYAVFELGCAGERVLIAPPECNDYAV